VCTERVFALASARVDSGSPAQSVNWSASATETVIVRYENNYFKGIFSQLDNVGGTNFPHTAQKQCMRNILV